MRTINFDKLKQVLPRVPGILKKKEYFNAAVLIPLVWHNEEYHFLFEKRGAKIRQGSEICFPGGEYDPSSDKSLLETAIRETREEVGIKKNKIKVLGKVDVLVGNMGVTVDPFIAEIKINSLDELSPDKDEVEKIFLIPVSYFYETPPETYFLKLEVHPFYTTMDGKKIDLFPAKDLDLPEKYLAPWTAGKHKVFAWRTKEGTIWGITAALIYEVIEKIKLSEEEAVK